MDEYKITLADGTVLEDIKKLETGQFYTEKPLNKDIFSTDSLALVHIELNNLFEDLYDQICDVFYTQDKITYFQFRNLTDLERLKLEYEAKLDYLAAMTGVDLDE